MRVYDFLFNNLIPVSNSSDKDSQDQEETWYCYTHPGWLSLPVITGELSAAWNLVYSHLVDTVALTLHGLLSPPITIGKLSVACSLVYSHILGIVH